MRHYVEKQITRQELSEVSCDLCGHRSPDGQWLEPEERAKRWESHEHHAAIAYVQSTAYGQDGGEGRQLKLDICPTCFLDKVLPALREMGLTREVEEYDW